MNTLKSYMVRYKKLTLIALVLGYAYLSLFTGCSTFTHLDAPIGTIEEGTRIVWTDKDDLTTWQPIDHCDDCVLLHGKDLEDLLAECKRKR